MISKNTMLLSTTLLAALFAAASSHPVEAKQKSAPAKAHKNYLVPPPPAYTPSFVTDRRATSATSSNPYGREVETEAKEDSEETATADKDKHFYTRDGYQEPKAVKPNRYVTYWNKS